MHTVNDKMQPFSHSRLRFVMKNVAMDDVFEQRPDQHTEQEKSHDRKIDNRCLQNAT